MKTVSEIVSTLRAQDGTILACRDALNALIEFHVPGTFACREEVCAFVRKERDAWFALRPDFLSKVDGKEMLAKSFTFAFYETSPEILLTFTKEGMSIREVGSETERFFSPDELIANVEHRFDVMLWNGQYASPPAERGQLTPYELTLDNGLPLEPLLDVDIDYKGRPLSKHVVDLRVTVRRDGIVRDVIRDGITLFEDFIPLSEMVLHPVEMAQAGR